MRLKKLLLWLFITVFFTSALIPASVIKAMDAFDTDDVENRTVECYSYDYDAYARLSVSDKKAENYTMYFEEDTGEDFENALKKAGEDISELYIYQAYTLQLVYENDDGDELNKATKTTIYCSLPNDMQDPEYYKYCKIYTYAGNSSKLLIDAGGRATNTSVKLVLGDDDQYYFQFEYPSITRFGFYYPDPAFLEEDPDDENGDDEDEDEDDEDDEGDDDDDDEGDDDNVVIHHDDENNDPPDDDKFDWNDDPDLTDDDFEESDEDDKDWDNEDDDDDGDDDDDDEDDEDDDDEKVPYYYEDDNGGYYKGGSSEKNDDEGSDSDSEYYNNSKVLDNTGSTEYNWDDVNSSSSSKSSSGSAIPRTGDDFPLVPTVCIGSASLLLFCICLRKILKK